MLLTNHVSLLQVAVLDSDDVYHFFHVLPSPS